MGCMDVEGGGGKPGSVGYYGAKEEGCQWKGVDGGWPRVDTLARSSQAHPSLWPIQPSLSKSSGQIRQIKSPRAVAKLTKARREVGMRGGWRKEEEEQEGKGERVREGEERRK